MFIARIAMAFLSTNPNTMAQPPVSVYRSEMVFDLAHELRTPLTVIQAALGLLESGQLGDLSERGQRMVQIAVNNADRLMRLTTALEQQSSNQTDYLTSEELFHLQLETELRSAVAHKEFQLFYQPLVSLRTKTVTGFEALIRWQHPYRGCITPDLFIPIAEKAGLIEAIGLWTIQAACQQLKLWQLAYPSQCSQLTVSVNLSSRQLTNTILVEQVQAILQNTQLSPEYLKLEITETAVLENPETAQFVLGQLRMLGIQLYIDDFGTGYSSLSRLHQLPIDFLKIDRSFIEMLASDANNGEQLIEAILNIAQGLSIEVIAEGIETLEQKLALQQLGCQYGQGYLFAKPIHPDQVIPFLIQYGL